MDMSSDDSSVTTAMMTPWLHFTGGDFVFFKTITPTSKGAMAGAAIFLFALAVFERFIVAIRSVKEAEWRHKTRVLLAARAASKDNKSLHADQRRRSIPPFIVSHDLARGVLHAFQALIHFALMLAVMTFQVAYIITIVVGLGFGELLFGRASALVDVGPSH